MEEPRFWLKGSNGKLFVASTDAAEIAARILAEQVPTCHPCDRNRRTPKLPHRVYQRYNIPLGRGK